MVCRFFSLGISLLTLTIPLTLAALDGPCKLDNGTSGVCISTSDCAKDGGTSTLNFCLDDPDNILCCTKSTCGGRGSNGVCRFTSDCGGELLAGICPGPEKFQCCVSGKEDEDGAEQGGSTGGQLGANSGRQPEENTSGQPGGSTESNLGGSAGGGTSADLSLSDRGVDFIAGLEGFEAEFYTDDAGVRTIGYGHACQTVNDCANITAPISVVEARIILRIDAAEAAACVNREVTVPLNQNQFDALVSFAFNLGCGNLRQIAARLNQNDFAGATEAMKQYINAGGRPLEGLRRRRNAEVALFYS